MTNQKLLPILENKNLVRDTSSKAILSTNKKMLDDHRQKKAFLKNLVEQSKEIDNLKKDISEIKRLLYRLLEDK